MLTGIHLSGLCLLSRGGGGGAGCHRSGFGWLAGHLISISPALDRPLHPAGASDEAQTSAQGSNGSLCFLFIYLKSQSTKRILGE